MNADDIVEHRPVKVGPLVDGHYVIESGLDLDDWVVVNGILRARAGAKVRPTRLGDSPSGSSKKKSPAGNEKTGTQEKP